MNEAMALLSVLGLAFLGGLYLVAVNQLVNWLFKLGRFGDDR